LNIVCKLTAILTVQNIIVEEQNNHTDQMKLKAKEFSAELHASASCSGLLMVFLLQLVYLTQLFLQIVWSKFKKKLKW